MMRIVGLIVVLGCLCGCSTLADNALEYPQVTFSQAEYRVLAGDSMGDAGDSFVWTEVVAAVSGAQSEENDARDTMLANILISKSDHICHEYFTDVMTVRNNTVSGLEIGALMSSTAAGLSSPKRSANLLGGVASFLLGTRSELESAVLDGADIRELRRAAMTGRRRIRQDLDDSLEAAQTGRDRLAVVVGRLGEYHQSCGLEFGVQERSRAIGIVAEDVADDTG